MDDFGRILAVRVPRETPDMAVEQELRKIAALTAVPELREMREGDVPQVVEIEGHSFDKQAYPREVFEDWLRFGLRGTVVAVGEKVAAYALERDDDRTPGFRLNQSIAVHPEFRRRGLGEMLVRDMVGRHEKVSADVDTANAASRKMFKKLGFVTVRTFKEDGRRAHRMHHLPAEKVALTLADLRSAAKETNTDPTDAQKEEGNYKKGRVRWKGLTLAIENPKGSVRSGDGWQITMRDHYGYVTGTESGADGDAVDFFLNDTNLDSEIVFVVNQRKKGGGFDEHKCVLGCVSREQAEKTYLRNYSAGWTGMGEVTPITLDHFKWWLDNADTSKEVKNGFFAAKENLKSEKRAMADPSTGDGLNITIDRPKGFKKTFTTKAGPKELKYPLDYGYFPGTINPEDNEDADVFVGTGGPHHGRFMKGKPGPDGAMVPDERKWYAGLHPHEYEALKNWWETQHDAGLTWDWTDLGDRQTLLTDAGVGQVKRANSGIEKYEPRLFLIKRGADGGDHPFTIAVDLDGTLAEQEEPFDVNSIGAPRAKAVGWVRRFHAAGARIIIFTVRGDTELVTDWADEHDVPYDHVNENPDQPPNSSGKVFADAYWDDRGWNAVDPDEHGPELLRRAKARGPQQDGTEDGVEVDGPFLLEALGDGDDEEERSGESE